MAQTHYHALLLMTALLLAGCNGATTALDAATPAPGVSRVPPEKTAAEKAADKTAEEAAAKKPAGDQTELAAAEPGSEAEKTAGAKIIHKPSTVTQKGNYIQVVVNNEPITNYDIQRRIKFRQLRRLKPTQDGAIQEMIDQTLKLQEAERRGTKASDAQVTQAFGNFAKSNRSTPQKIAADLDRIGVGAKHFRDFIRTQISWSRTVGSKLQSETRDRSQSDALFEIRKKGGEKPETTEYTLQQIVFVIPHQAKSKERIKNRKAEALAFAQRFSGCASSIDMAKGLRDVTVKEVGRKLQPELPPEWSEDIQKAEIGKTTAPKETELGIELFAVCSSRIVQDDRAAQVVSQSHAYDALEEKGNAAGDDMLAELRKSATIIYK